MKIAVLALLSAALLCASCKDEPSPAVARVCQESIARGRALLAVPDHEAARDWLALAKKQCGANASGEIALFEREIDASARRQAEAEAQRRRDLEPKPPAPSLVPEVLAMTAAYRDDKTRRTTCDQQAEDNSPICEGTRKGVVARLNVTTVKKDPSAYSVFAELPQELVDCSAFGPHEVKRTWKRGGDPAQYCVLTSGPLASMLVFIQQRLAPPESEVTIFTKAWTGHDADLAERISRVGDP